MHTTPVPTSIDDGSGQWSVGTGGTWTELGAALQVNGLWALGLIVFFELGRRRHLSMYCNKAGAVKYDNAKVFGWIKPLLQMNDDALAGLGIDAYCTVLYLRLMKWVFGIMAFFGIVVLFPLYATGRGGREGFFSWTVDNLSADSPRFWAPLVSLVLLTASILLGMEMASAEFLKRRRQYLCQRKVTSIAVERLPRKLQSDTALRDYFKALFGNDQILSAFVYLNLSEVEALLKKRNALAARYETMILKTHKWSRENASNTSESCCPLLTRIDHTVSIDNTRDDAQNLQELGRALDEANIAFLEAKALAMHREDQFPLSETPRPTRIDKESTLESRPPTTTTNGDNAIMPPPMQVLASVSSKTMRGAATTFGLDLAAAYETSSSGIVTTSSLGSATTIAQLVVTGSPLDLEVNGLAPEPRDLVWRNACVAIQRIEWRETLVDVACYLFAAFALTPVVAFIQLLSNLQEVAKLKHMHFLRPFMRKKKYAYLRALVSGYLPVLLMLAFMSIIPAVLYYLGLYYIKHKTYSNIQNFIARRYFCFQLATLFVTIFTGSVSSLLHDFWHDPASVAHKFGQGLPKIADYFAILVLSKALFSTTQEISQIWPYFKRRQKDPLFLRPVKPQPFCFGQKVPDLFMVASVALVYASIAPLVTIFAFLYFCLTELVFIRQFTFVYHNHYERGGFYVWDAVILFSSLGLALAQAILISFFSIQKRYQEAAITAILVGVVYLHYYRLKRFYIEPAKHLDRHTAILHSLFQDSPSENSGSEATDTMYRHPALLTQSLDAALVRSRLSAALTGKQSDSSPVSDTSSSFDSWSTQNHRHSSTERGLSIPTLRRQASSPSTSMHTSQQQIQPQMTMV